MSMTEDINSKVKVELAVDNADAEELDQLTANLRRELLQLDVDEESREREGAPPPGARAAELIALGSLIVAIGKAAGALSSVVRAVQGWVGRKPDRKVRLEIDGDAIELSAASPEQQQQLVDEWLARHGTK